MHSVYFRLGKSARYCFLTMLILMITLQIFPKSKHAPLPDELLAAKTVYFVNKTGNQSTLDTAYDQFQKWGRYSIVNKKETADIIVVFTHDAGLDEGTTVGFTHMNVYLKNSEEAAFEATERYRSKLFGNSSVKQCVSDFKHRLEAN